MKKVILIMLLSVVICTVKTYGQGYGVGVKGGLNVSTLLSNTDELEDWGPLVGGHFAGYGYYMFTKNVGLEAALMYSMAGFYIEVYDDGDYFDEDIRLNYFAVPISARFKFGYFTLNPGVQLGMLMSAKNENGDDLSDVFSATDVSVFLTPGVELPMGLKIGTTVNFGLTKLIEDSNEKNTNFVFQLSIGYTFLRKNNDE